MAAIDVGCNSVEGHGGTLVTAEGTTETVERNSKVDLHRDLDLTAYVRGIAALPGVTRVAVDELFPSK